MKILAEVWFSSKHYLFEGWRCIDWDRSIQHRQVHMYFNVSSSPPPDKLMPYQYSEVEDIDRHRQKPFLLRERVMSYLHSEGLDSGIRTWQEDL